MANIKIYDIRPPRKVKKISPDKEVLKQPKKSDAKANIKKISIIFIFFIILSLVVIQFFNASKATISIWPKTQENEYQVFITAVPQQKEFDVLAQTIPATVLEKEEVLIKEFQSPKINIGEKAKGTIRVHSKHHLPTTLIANTRFLSSTEPTRQFVALKRFTVPAGGYVDVDVVASEAGSDYNIGPSTFSIPGLRNFSPPELYYNLYGKSSEEMTGGGNKEIFKIDKKAVEKAKEVAEKEAREMIQKELEKLAGQDKLLQKSIYKEILESSAPSAQEQEQKEFFTYKVKIRGKALIVKNSQLSDFIIKYLSLKMPRDKDVNKEKIAIKNFSENIDKENNITIDLTIASYIFSKIEDMAIKEMSRNQRVSNIKRYLTEIYPQMQKEPKIKTSPFFLKKLPESSESVEIQIKFE